MDDGGLSGLGEYGVHSEFLERSSGKALLAAMPPDCTIPINRTHAVLAVFLILGTLVAYSPQLLKIYRSRSSDGFSPWYLMLGALSCTSGFLNIIILQSPIMRCCTAVPFGQCLYNILGFLQTAAQAAMFFSLLALFYVYFPDGKKTISSAEDEGRISKDWRNSLYSLKVIFTFMVFTSVISATIIVQFGVPSRAATAWTAALALVSIIGSIIQFIPQIMRTWRHKMAGALSVPAMMMQTPGSFLFCYTIAMSPGTNFSSWIAYLIGGCLQGTLLLLCMYYQHTAPSEFIRIREEDFDE